MAARLLHWCSILAIAAALSACPVVQEKGSLQGDDVGERAAGEYLIGLTDEAAEERAKSRFAPYGIGEWRRVSEGIYLLRLERDPGIEALQRTAGGTDRVRYIEPNRLYRAQ
ncbi:MAG: hypothetical protein Kow006_10010 [Gammaproteobacteria bacterium]